MPSLNQFINFYDFASACDLILTAEGTIHDANLTACTYLGMEHALLLGQSLSNFLDPSSHPDFTAFFQELLTHNGQQVCEVHLLGDPPRLTRFDGLVVPTSLCREWRCRVVLIAATEDRESAKQIEILTKAYRRNAEEKEGILNALPARIALLDPHGRIVAVNERWKDFALAHAPEDANFFIAHNYLEVCDNAKGEGSEDARAVAQGLRAILNGQELNFTHEYACHSPQQQNWSRLYAAPISTECPAGAVVMHVDITRRQIAEAESQRRSDEMRALARRLEVIHDKQAARIARELHDELGQTLTILKLHVRTMQKRIEAHADATPSLEAREAIELIETSVTSLRRLCTELRPPMLDHLGLGPALTKLAADFQARFLIPCTLEAPSDFPLLDRQLQARVYRLVQELLTNVARHAGASAVRIGLRQIGGMLELEVSDNGRGITNDEQVGMKGLGVLGMRERAMAAGGTIIFEGHPGQGTTARASLPLTPPAELS